MAEEARKEDNVDGSDATIDDSFGEANGPFKIQVRPTSATITHFASIDEMRTQLPTMLKIDAALLETMIVIAFQNSFMQELEFADRVHRAQLTSLAVRTRDRDL